MKRTRESPLTSFLENLEDFLKHRKSVAGGRVHRDRLALRDRGQQWRRALPRETHSPGRYQKFINIAMFSIKILTNESFYD